jgi:hypothetical protein
MLVRGAIKKRGLYLINPSTDFVYYKLTKKANGTYVISSKHFKYSKGITDSLITYGT